MRLAKLMMGGILALSVVGCGTPFGLKDTEVLKESTDLIVDEYNAILSGEKSVDDYSDEQRGIKIERNNAYKKYVTDLYHEAGGKEETDEEGGDQ